MTKIVLSLRLLFLIFLPGAALAQVKTDSLTVAFQQRLKDPSKTSYGRHQPAGHSWKIRGFSFYAEQYGAGAPLLFIHGNGVSIADFTYQIDFFKDRYHVIAADNRSHGKSFDRGDSLTYEMMADDYAVLLDSLKLDSVNVVGWSDGGIIGLLLALRHPEKVRKLVPVGANLQPDSSAVYQEVWDMVLPMYQSLKDKPNKNVLEKNSFKLLRLLSEQPHIPAGDLKKIRIPVMVVAGDNDLIKAEHSLLIFRSLPRAYLWIVPGSGHSVPIFYRDEFNSNVDRFLQNEYRPITGENRFQ